MTTGQRIEIPLSKSKLIIMLAGSLLFAGIGVWFVVAPPQIDNSYWGHPVKLAIVGYASLVFFGLCAVALVRKLPDNSPGLIIDDTGLVDNSSGLSAGPVLWADIENISVLQIHKQKLLMLGVKNPQDYIDRQTGLLKRKTMELNYRMYGTPLSITANGLKISFDELLHLVATKFEATRSNAQQQPAALQAERS